MAAMVIVWRTEGACQAELPVTWRNVASLGIIIVIIIISGAGMAQSG